MQFGEDKKLVEEVMSKDFEVVNEDLTLDAAMELMFIKNLREIFVKNSNEKIIGIITFTDIYNSKKFGKNSSKSIKNYMNKEIIYITKNMDISECKEIMFENKIKRLPVFNEEKLIGIIREEEVIKHFYLKMEDIRNRLDNIINSIHEAVCAIDKDGKVSLWNKNAEKLYNVLAKDILGKKLEDFFPDAALNTVRKTQEAIENRYHSPREGSYIIISALPVYVNGEFVGAVSTDRDITEVKTLSNKLEKANSKLDFLENEMKKFSGSFGEIIGKSAKLTQKIEIARHVSQSDASVIITGESGTGKEVFSRAIHEESRRKGLFVPVNCSAIPSELFESELFGYEAGAFTGANKKGKMGIFELANQGTIFLDEIGDMPMYMQAKLLRVLQERELMRVGGEKKIKIDVRVISATNKDLKKMVEKGTFREDLYYRLNVVEIHLPPLRERKDDILILINHFLKVLSQKNGKNIPKIDKEVLNILQNYEWKGNIRELKNTVEHLLVINKGDVIYKESIPYYIIKGSQEKKEDKNYPLDLNEAIKNVEIQNIKRALELSNQNKAKAAKMLNIPRSTLYYKMEHYDIKCQ